MTAAQELSCPLYAIVDIYTGKQAGKTYWSKFKARQQASRLNRSCNAYRFRVEEVQS